MKGSRSILTLLALVLCLSTAAAWAQDEYAKPIGKSYTPSLVQAPTGQLKYNAINYTFITRVSLTVVFETIDQNRVKLTVKPVSPVEPYYDFSVQWSAFPPVMLELDDGSGSYILNTETGYAEK